MVDFSNRTFPFEDSAAPHCQKDSAAVGLHLPLVKNAVVRWWWRQPIGSGESRWTGRVGRCARPHQWRRGIPRINFSL
jgi:hypothetical protein